MLIVYDHNNLNSFIDKKQHGHLLGSVIEKFAAERSGSPDTLREVTELQYHHAAEQSAERGGEGRAERGRRRLQPPAWLREWAWPAGPVILRTTKRRRRFSRKHYREIMNVLNVWRTSLTAVLSLGCRGAPPCPHRLSQLTSRPFPRLVCWLNPLIRI